METFLQGKEHECRLRDPVRDERRVERMVHEWSTMRAEAPVWVSSTAKFHES